MTTAAARDLKALELLRERFDPEARARKLALLEALSTAPLATARQVERLHEVLLFLWAYPDDEHVRARAQTALEGFDRRRDLKRHARALADTGIAGAAIHYPFFTETAAWLAERWPALLHLDPPTHTLEERLDAYLPALALFAETPGLDEAPLSVGEWIDRLKGPDETAAAFLVRRFQQVPMAPDVKEALYEEIGPALRLEAGADTPSRTRSVVRGVGGVAGVGRTPLAPQRGPLRRERPRLWEDVERGPQSIRSCTLTEGWRLVTLAREQMITRQRDLDAFAYGDPRDVRIVTFEGGLQFAAIGVRPERRLLLEAVYGFLTLKNGVPTGYVLASALFGSSEVAYNVFDTFRGGEAGWIYGRVLAMLRALFQVDAFTIYPYQLGHENSEGLKSGSWWFYQKLGFRARDRGVLRLMEQELVRMRKDAKHRSSIATLKRLAVENVYAFRDAPRDDVIGLFPLQKVGLAVTDMLARRFGFDRRRAERTLVREAADVLGLESVGRLSPGERLAFTRWAPLVTILPGLASWSEAERRELLAVVRAKGGRRESDFVLAFDRHRRLRQALVDLVARVEV